jgi:hypothetical protein
MVGVISDIDLKLFRDQGLQYYGKEPGDRRITRKMQNDF